MNISKIKGKLDYTLEHPYGFSRIKYEYIPAPTFEELWQLIPTQRNFILNIDEVDGQMMIAILDRLANELFQRSHKLPQEALAEIMIQLKKEGLI